MDLTSLDLTTAIIFAAIALILGFVMGLLAGGSGDEEEKPSPLDKDIDPNWVDVARFWWDKRNNDLVLRTRERTYLKGAKIRGAERKHISRILQELHTWVTQEPLPDVDPVVSMRESLFSDPENRPAALLLSPVDAVARAIQADIPQVAAEPFNIIEQINAILQEMLAEAHVKDKAIRLMDFPNRGMVVLIGLDQYDSIDDVPDEGIKSLLRAAVAEWESRQVENR